MRATLLFWAKLVFCYMELLKYCRNMANVKTLWYSEVVPKNRHTLTSKCSPIVHVAISESSGWQYNSTGHYLAIYSMLSDYSKVAICDPYGGYVGVNSWRWYDKETKNVYAALKHGYIYVTT